MEPHTTHVGSGKAGGPWSRLFVRNNGPSASETAVAAADNLTAKSQCPPGGSSWTNSVETFKMPAINSVSFILCTYEPAAGRDNDNATCAFDFLK